MFFKFLNDYIKNNAGVAAIIFAFSIPMILGTTGIGIDLAKAYHTQNKLEKALDAAALAGSSSSRTGADLEDFMKDFVEANFKATTGSTLDRNDITIDLSNDRKIILNATATSDNNFMTYFDNESIEVAAFSEVTRQTGVEIVIVMDHSGSMTSSIDGGSESRLEALNRAVLSFVDILERNIPNDDFLKIGLVSYANSVNVGDAAMNDMVTTTARQFVDNKIDDGTNIPYSSNIYSTAWAGCVQDNPAYLRDDYAGPYAMYRRYRNIRPDLRGIDKDDDYTDERLVRRNGYYFPNTPNYQCPEMTPLPLTNDMDAVRNKIASVPSSVVGATVGSAGMAWGWRLISPNPPYDEGAAYNDDEWKKFVILMTDGEFNTGGDYNAYGHNGRNNNVRSSDADHYDQPSDTRSKTVDICDNMKDEGITIYTINFIRNPTSAQERMMQDCSADPAETGYPRYVNTTNNDDLVETFEDIAASIASTHISK